MTVNARTEDEAPMTRRKEEKHQNHAQRLEEASLVIVTAPSFVAALLIHRGEVLTYAPILARWIQRRKAAEALDVFRAQGWRVEVNPTL